MYSAPDDTWLAIQNPDAICEFLRVAEVVDSEQMETGTTGIHRLVLEANGIRARAAFRSVDIKQERVQLAHGAYAAFYDRAMSEIAAYELSRMLEFPLVPPAVARDWDGEAGSLQLWVEDAITEGERARTAANPAGVAYWSAQQAAMAFFDALIGNEDRNTGNALLDSHGFLWLIDHTRAFQRPRRPAEITGVTRVPADLLERVRHLDADSARRDLGPYLDGLQITTMFDRRDALIEHIDSLIAERGVDAVVLAPLGR
jgi:hypothetical protein